MSCNSAMGQCCDATGADTADTTDTQQRYYYEHTHTYTEPTVHMTNTSLAFVDLCDSDARLSGSKFAHLIRWKHSQIYF